MLPLIIEFPSFKRELITIGPIAIRWYALAYIAGLILGWLFAKRLCRQPPYVVAPEKFDDFLLWAAGGVVLGGRLGYVLFYKPLEFAANPLTVFEIWHGGMSFHGGLLGVIAAILLYTWRQGLLLAPRSKPNLWSFADICAAATPPGLFFGRVANFINGELWGRTTDVSWAMIFPDDPTKMPRHPSQLYQALLEGVVLFAVLLIAIYAFKARRRPGMVAGLFLVGYAVARIIGELFREPDSFLGFVLGDAITMGQILSLPALLFGAWMMWRAAKGPVLSDKP
jgi:phosphatidylglycerol:prolipoprotein diacylglycerol transferase